MNHIRNPRQFIRKSVGVFILFLPGGILSAQNIVVDAAPSHAANSFSPVTSLVGAIDRLRGGPTKEDNEKNTERLLTNPVLKEMLGAGWQTVTYRQNTELMIEAWHWNARGTWSNPAKQEGYFVGSPEPTDQKIMHSWAYPLPHRGATLGDGNGWSRLTDGNLHSYWKSNPYLARPFTGEDDSKHPQWVMIDLGSKVNVNAARIAWANPYATRYVVQFWTSELEPFYEGINKGTLQAFPMSTIDDGKGGTSTLKRMHWQHAVHGPVSAHQEAVMDKYDSEKKVSLVVDEWGAWHAPLAGSNPAFLVQQNSIRDAILASLNLNIFARHADRVRMANIAQMINVLQAMILTDKERMVVTPTYHVFRMYVPFQDSTFVPIAFDAGTYTQGSVTLPRVDAIAAKRTDGKLLVEITNLDAENPATIDAHMAGVALKSATAKTLTAPAVDSLSTYRTRLCQSPRQSSFRTAKYR